MVSKKTITTMENVTLLLSTIAIIIGLFFNSTHKNISWLLMIAGSIGVVTVVITRDARSRLEEKWTYDK